MNDTKEWFEGRLLIDNAAMARCYWKRVLAFLVVGLVVLLLVWPANANADPVFRASGGGTVVTLHSENCKVEAVKNLPQRATWEEKGKTYEGCYLMVGPFVLMYFDDKTVGLAPREAFERVQGV